MVGSLMYFERALVVAREVHSTSSRTAFFARVNSYSALIITGLQLTVTGSPLPQLQPLQLLQAQPLQLLARTVELRQVQLSCWWQRLSCSAADPACLPACPPACLPA
jgi:hypothetical protein